MDIKGEKNFKNFYASLKWFKKIKVNLFRKKTLNILPINGLKMCEKTKNVLYVIDRSSRMINDKSATNHFIKTCFASLSIQWNVSVDNIYANVNLPGFTFIHLQSSKYFLELRKHLCGYKHEVRDQQIFSDVIHVSMWRRKFLWNFSLVVIDVIFPTN